LSDPISPHDGPEQMRTARRAAGLTQRDLARMAELHVRTIRNMELGSIRSPRLGSIARVADALQMHPLDRQSFLAAWGRRERGGTPARAFSEDELAVRLERQLRELDIITVSDTVRVGPDGRREWCDSQPVIVARADGVSHGYVPITVEDELRTAQVRVYSGHGATIGRELASPEGLRLVELVFDHPLRLGESHSFRFRLDYRRAHLRPEPDPTTTITRDLLAPMSSYVLEVRFGGVEPRRLPSRCEQVFAAAAGHALESVRPLPVGADRAVHLALSNPGNGRHGVRLIW
jgi:transcriptional regulator with XRE-family HTH domain